MRRHSRSSLPLRWLKWTLLALELLGRFARELLVANLQQARLVLGWPLEVQPRWIRFQTRLRSESSRTLLGALISMTPGTLTCDLDGEILLIHSLNARSEEDAVAGIRRHFESLLLRMEEIE